MPNVSSRDLSVALAERLNEAIPLGFAVHAIGTDLVVLHEGDELGTSGAPAIMETIEAVRHPAENLETAVRAALSAIQDYIAETTTLPWPADSGTRTRGSVTRRSRCGSATSTPRHCDCGRSRGDSR